MKDRKQKERINLKGCEYVAPRTESAGIVNQGVLCASGALGGSIKSWGDGSPI